MLRLIRYTSILIIAALPFDVAFANCVCRCVNGSVQALCSSSIDLPPICAPQICPITPPSIAPIQAPSIPPIGTTQ